MMKWIGILFVLIGIVSPVAASDFSIKISPAFQDFEVTNSEDVIVKTVEITNETDITLLLELFAVDFVQSDEFGSVSFVNQVGSAYRLADYIEFPEDTVDIAPGETAQVKVNVLNKDDFTLGGHYGAIVARSRQQNVGDYQQVLPAVSSLFLVHKVGGERFNLSLKSFTIDGGTFRWQNPKNMSLTLANEGNIHIVPKGVVTVTDLFDRVVFKGFINESSSFVLPQARRNFTVQLERLRPSLPLMLYTVDIDGSSNVEVTYFAQEQLVVITPIVVLTLLGLIFAAIFISKKLRSKKSV